MSTSNSLPKIIGIAGTFASGQDSLAKYLVEKHGYIQFSTSDAIRKVAMERYGSIERPILHKTGTELRKELGPGAFTLMGVEFLKSHPNATGVAISGIRSMGELKKVVSLGGIMLFTDADFDLRYERMVSRARDSESKVSRQEFAAREAAEYHVGDTDIDFNRRDIQAFCEQAGTIILNNGAKAKFYKAIEAALRKKSA